MDEINIKQIISSAQKELGDIQDSHRTADAKHKRVRNMLSIAEMELKFHELNKMDTASCKLIEIVRVLGANVEPLREATTKADEGSTRQQKQTKVLIVWTAIMAFAVFAQVVVGSVQAFIYYKQLELSRINTVQQK